METWLKSGGRGFSVLRSGRRTELKSVVASWCVQPLNISTSRWVLRLFLQEIEAEKHVAGTDWKLVLTAPPPDLRNTSITLPPIADCPLRNGLVLSNTLAETRLYKQAVEKSERCQRGGGGGGGGGAIREIYSDREMVENSLQLEENSENHWMTVMCGGGGGGEDDGEDTGGGVISVIRWWKQTAGSDWKLLLLWWECGWSECALVLSSAAVFLFLSKQTWSLTEAAAVYSSFMRGSF